jgi:hypothetical protein
MSSAIRLAISRQPSTNAANTAGLKLPRASDGLSQLMSRLARPIGLNHRLSDREMRCRLQTVRHRPTHEALGFRLVETIHFSVKPFCHAAAPTRSPVVARPCAVRMRDGQVLRRSPCRRLEPPDRFELAPIARRIVRESSERARQEARCGGELISGRGC